MARLRPTQWGICVNCQSNAILYDGNVCEHCADIRDLEVQLAALTAERDAALAAAQEARAVQDEVQK